MASTAGHSYCVSLLPPRVPIVLHLHPASMSNSETRLKHQKREREKMTVETSGRKSHCIAPCTVCYLTQLNTMFYIYLVTYATTLPSYCLDCTWIQIRQCFPDQSHRCLDHGEKHFVGHQGCEYPTKVQLGTRIPVNISHETGVILHWAVQDTDFFDLKTPILLTISDIVHR